MISKLARLIAAAIAAPGAAFAAELPGQFNLQPPQSPIAEQIYELHTLIMWIIFGIFVLVFGVMAIAIVKHRKSVGHKAEQFHENTTVEIIWTIVPFVILIGMAYPATKTVISMKDTTNPDITIKATGYQWKWGYDYINWGDKPYHVHFISKLDAASDKARQLKSGLDPWTVKGKDIHEKDSGEQTYLLDVDHPLVVPVDTKIRFVVTGDDVIHSWWVPALGWKQDAIPGIVNEAWTDISEPGIYRGQCAELCGKDHGFMPIVVKAVPPEEFKAWLDQQEAAQNPSATPAAAPVAQQTPTAAPSNG